MRNVTNEEFEQALQNVDNKNIIRCVCNKYSNFLDENELSSCSMVGLWKALQAHNSQYRTPFTSSLFRHVQWECLRLMKRNRRHKTVAVDPAYLDSLSDNDGFSLEDALDTLSDEQKIVVEERFYEGKTFQEIGQRLGQTKEAARQHVKRAVGKLRCILS